jgi:ATP-dependent Lon protease
MEVIRLAGYTEDEKINIANKYLTYQNKLKIMVLKKKK